MNQTRIIQREKQLLTQFIATLEIKVCSGWITEKFTVEFTFRRKQTRPNVTSPIISKRGSARINNSNTLAKRQC